MKRRKSRRTPSADLLVCFTPRSHLTLMPKPICSPARYPDPTSFLRHRSTGTRPPPPPLPPRLNKSHTRRVSGDAGRRARETPDLWVQTKRKMGAVSGQELSEPSSPKVTCSGQIKLPHRSSSWQSVMHKIERIHDDRKHFQHQLHMKNCKKKNKKPSWTESLGFKKEVMQFLTCLRSITFDFRCFSPFRGATTISSEDEEEEEDDDGKHLGIKEKEALADPSDDALSRWYMLLNESKIKDDDGLNQKARSLNADDDAGVDDLDREAFEVQPPPNALLLMRCRSAPAKTRFDERRRDMEEEEEEKLDLKMKTIGKGAENGNQEENEEENVDEKKKTLEILMRCEAHFQKSLSSLDVGNETWFVGGITYPLSRSRSWKI